MLDVELRLRPDPEGAGHVEAVKVCMGHPVLPDKLPQDFLAAAATAGGAADCPGRQAEGGGRAPSGLVRQLEAGGEVLEYVRTTPRTHLVHCELSTEWEAARFGG